MNNVQLEQLARETAQRHGIDQALFCALCDHESGWNTYAIRYEPAFFTKYVAPQYTAGKISATEAYARGFSWGLGQIMGQTAREFGFDRGSLAALCEPEVGLEYAAKKLASALSRESGDVTKALLRYNGGSNAAYPSLVKNLLPKYSSTNHIAVQAAATGEL